MSSPNSSFTAALSGYFVTVSLNSSTNVFPACSGTSTIFVSSSNNNLISDAFFSFVSPSIASSRLSARYFIVSSRYMSPRYSISKTNLFLSIEILTETGAFAAFKCTGSSEANSPPIVSNSKLSP